MKKFFVFWACFFCLPFCSFCQNTLPAYQTVTGNVRDENKQPVAYASLLIKGTKNGTTADSLGFFKIKVKPDAELLVTKVGYQDALVKINTDSVIIIFLKTDEKTLQSSKVSTVNTKEIISRNDIVNQQIIAGTIGDFTKANTTNIYSGSFLPVFNPKEDTKGSPYLFEKWVSGAVLDSAGSMVNSNDYLFNYDKMNNRLLFKKDAVTVIEVDYKIIRGFELTNGGNKYYFEKVPFINNQVFLQKLNRTEGKYSCYKKIKTHFERSNYKSEGLIESGNKYDEYVDEFEYFIVLNDYKQYEAVRLKKKSILDVFSENGFSENSKMVNDYFAKHKSDYLDEAFLAGLIDFLNAVK